MYKKQILRNRIIAMLMCILLLSNLSMSIVLASDDDSSAVGLVTMDSDVNMKTSVSSSGAMTAELSTKDKNNATLWFTPTETMVIQVTVTNKKGQHINYEVQNMSNQVLPLACRFANNKGTILTTDTSEGSTTIDVVVRAGQRYKFDFYDADLGDDTIVSIKKRNIGSYPMAVTNISSAKISNRDHADGQAIEGAGSFRLVHFTDAEIEEYLKNGAEEQTDYEPGNFLETILVKLVLAIGSIFMWIAEQVLGANTTLTIDNIIFNRFDQTVIDLAPLGGIDVPMTGKGIFYDSNVGHAINTLYNGLKDLTVMIYVAMLLYIGVKILLSIGGKNQKKYLKYLEYWLTGALLLTILPYFLPAIPALSNAFITQFEISAKSMNNQYTVSEVLMRLGYDPSYLGEDAETVELLALVDDRIEELQGKIDGQPTTRGPAQEKINETVTETIEGLPGYEGKKDELYDLVDKTIEYVNDEYRDWNSESESGYDKVIGSVSEYVYQDSGITQSFQSRIPSSVKNNTKINQAVNGLEKYLRQNALKWTSDEKSYRNELTFGINVTKLQREMAQVGISREDIEATTIALAQTKNSYIDYGRSDEAISSIGLILNDYKNAVIQAEIEELIRMKNGISSDVMTILKTKAGEESRFVYAVAWVILLFQLFAILFMYYKRVIAVAVLIIIFPLIMAFYVIDKIGDGKAQSLESWLKEFVANITVQLMHAVCYLVLINAGIEVCNIDPEANWFFLILAVCFLFPGERILRSILGLSASTLGGLRVNIGSVALGAHMAGKLAKGAYKGAKDIKDGKGGPIKKTTDKYLKEAQKERERQEKVMKEKQELAQRGAKLRRKHRLEREARIAAGNGGIIDKALSKVDKAKDVVGNVKTKITGWAPIKVAASATKATGNAVKNTYRYGKMTLKKGAGILRKGAGLAFGAVEGMENFAYDGAASAMLTTASVAKDIGGFQSMKPEKAEEKQQEKPKTPPQFATRYQDGEKVSGYGNATEGNVETQTTKTNRINEQAKQRRSIEDAKLEVKSHIKNVQTNDNTGNN